MCRNSCKHLGWEAAQPLQEEKVHPTFGPAKTPTTPSLANASLGLDRYFHCKLEALGHEEHHTKRPKSKDLCGKDGQIGADLCNSHRSDAVIS